MIDEATVEQFRVSLRGDLIQPGDEGYAEARKVYNCMIDKRPRMIVEPTMRIPPTFSGH